jgi:two-component system LytT family response regulator
MSNLENKKALIIEDDADSINVLRVMLDQLHIQTTVISDPNQFEEHLGHLPFTPDIVFLDLELGNTTGFDVLLALQACPEYAVRPS